MSRTLPVLPMPLAACILLVLAASPATGGIRTRGLPPLAVPVEESLRARAARADAPRIHALLEVSRGSRRQVEASGVRLLRSVDGDLYLASLSCRALAAGELPRGVEGAWDLTPGDRRSPGLADRLAGSLAPGETVALRVKVFRDSPFAPVRARVLREGGEILFEAPRLGILDVSVSPQVLGLLTERDDVRWVEPAPPRYETANNSMRVDAEVDAVQALGLTGAGVVVGMWDSGLPDSTHPDLAGRVIGAEPSLLTTVHSSNVAGIVLGDGTNSSNQGGGGLQWRGVATTATVVNYDVPGALAEVDSAISLYDIDLSTNSWIYRVNADTLNNCSLYGAYASDAPEFDDIVRGIYGKPLPVVFAAGNERDDGDCGIPQRGGFACLPPPGTAKNVITVGAHHSDAGHMTPFSSWGPTVDGRLKPDVSAPGCQASGDFGVTSTSLAGTYLAMCGTSQATPVVSGSIAVLLEDWRARFPGDPRPATYKALLAGFAKDRANPGPDYRFGHGAIHLDASVTALRTATTIEDSVDDAQVDTWTFLVPAGADTVAVTLAWDDPAGAELADSALVNDLDLELVAPTAGTFLPFVLDAANPDAPATTDVNRVDNLEQVRVLLPEAGTWTARVLGTAVPLGPQGYSLVGFDGRAPADPAALAAVAVSDTTVQVTWIRPGDADRAGTLVVRSVAPVAWTPVDGIVYGVGSEPSPGVFVIAADDIDHETVPLVDEPLPPGTVHHYALFAYDEIPNYSLGVADTAQTSSNAVGVTPLLPPPAGIAFRSDGPNPFREATAFRLELPAPAFVSVDVYDTAGRLVATVVRGERQAGSHRIAWDGRERDGRAVAAGIYFVRLRTAGLTATEKVLRLP